MARYDRHYDFGLRGYDRGISRGYGYPRPNGGTGYGSYEAARGYDNGYRASQGGVRPGGRGGYDGGYRPDAGYRASRPARYDERQGMRGGSSWLPNRVTARYNLDYVHPQGERRPLNYTSFGGDVEGRVGDMTEYARPYATRGGTYTWRGGSRPVGWENDFNRMRGYDGYGGRGW